MEAKIPVVKVKVAESAEEFFILADKYMQVGCYKGGHKVCDYYAYTGLTAKLQSGKMILQEGQGILESGLDQMTLVPRRFSQYISINGKKFRGSLEILKDQESKNLIGVNQVSLEEYLQGVVPLEMGIKLVTGKKDQEALKAQAVAARTYALSKLGQYPGQKYDLVSTVSDQVYGGMDAEEDLTNLAVRKTRGEILTYNKELVKAYFHANCGGHTESIEKAWPWKSAEDYLLSKPDSEFCSWASNYNWTLSLSKARAESTISGFLGSQLKDSTFSCGNLKDLQAMERSESGRIMLLKVISDKGEWEVRSDSIRWCFRKIATNGGILPSTKFDIKITRNQDQQPDSIEFSGYGNGHGVGMCQIGALGRARAGQSYRKIIAFYYPGTKLIKKYY